MISTTFGQLYSTGAILFSDGYRTKRAEHGRPGFRILRVADVANGRVTAHGDDFVHSDYQDAIGPKLSQRSDVLLTTKGTVGRVAIYPEQAEQVVYSPQLCFFRVLDPNVLHPRYLAYWFKSAAFKIQAAHRANNTDMAAYINLQDISSLEITLPEIGKQRAITEVLGALDDKVSVNEHLHSLADQLCAAEVRRVSQAGVRRHLRDMLTLHYGKALPASERTPGNVVVYGSGGITGTHSRPLVNRPGVIVGRKGTVGTVYWASGPHFPIDTTYYVEPREAGTDEILYYLLQSAPLAELNSDSAVPGLNRDEAYACQVNFPEKDSLETLAGTLRQRFWWMKTVREEMKTLAATRDELLPLLMSGKIRVREAEKIVEGVV